MKRPTRSRRAATTAAALDQEDLKVSTHPGFAALIARSEARYRREGGISLEDVRTRTSRRPAAARRSK
ncbi:MAG: hypothetical protein AB7K71_28325 [Polyangiaceae bacterium]